jgi:hypothetical protein
MAIATAAASRTSTGSTSLSIGVDRCTAASMSTDSQAAKVRAVTKITKGATKNFWTNVEN